MIQPLCQKHRIEDATIDQVQVWFGEGSLTSAQLTQCYLDRIAQTNE
jgi:amidase